MYITGEKVILHTKTQDGIDEFGAPIYTDGQIEVDNVLIGHPTSEDITESINLYGKKVVYVLSIPKDDTNEWENTIVEFRGKKYKTIGYAVEWNKAMLPLSWNKQIKVEMHDAEKD